MKDAEAYAVREHRVLLVETLSDAFELLLLDFRVRGIISSIEAELIKVEKLSPTMTMKLLDLLLRKEGTWGILCDYLIRNHYTDIATKLKDCYQSFINANGADAANKTSTPAALLNCGEFEIEQEPFTEGALAYIYKATWLPLHRQVALKQIKYQDKLNHQNKQESETYDAFMKEISLMSGLWHSNIVDTFGYVEISSKRVCVVMELADQNLHELMSNVDKAVDEVLKIDICIGIAAGLEYLHSKQIVHRDLKPDNILLFGNDNLLIPKLADFGLSCFCRTTMMSQTSLAGMAKYLASELFVAKSKYNWSVDIFSLSLIMYEFFAGLSVDNVFGTDEHTIMYSISQGKRPDNFDVGSRRILGEMETVMKNGWYSNIKDRPSAVDNKLALLHLKARLDDLPHEDNYIRPEYIAAESLCKAEQRIRKSFTNFKAKQDELDSCLEGI